MNSHPFDAIVLRLSAEVRRSAVGVNQKKLAVHRAGSDVLIDSVPFLGADKYTYYRLTLDATAAFPEAKVTLTDQHPRKRQVVYHLNVTGFNFTGPAVAEGGPARECLVRFGRMLAKAPVPFDALNMQIGQWLQEHIVLRSRGGVSPLAAFTEAERKLAGERVQQRALEQWGLLVDCHLRVPEEDVAQLKLNLQIPVLVQDCEDQLEAKLEIELERPRNAEEFQSAIAHVQPREEIEERLKAITVEWFRNKCTLEYFCYPEYKKQVRESLQRDLETYIVEELCRRIFTLRITCTAKFPTSFPTDMLHVVDCNVDPGQTNVRIKHQLLLERKNIAFLTAQQRDNFEGFVRGLLDAKTKAVFFGAHYVKVITKFEELEKSIKEGVEKSLIAAGFDVTLLITKADDPEIGRLIGKTFSFDTAKPDMESALGGGPAPAAEDPTVFGTKDARFNFGLSVQARVHLKSFDKVTELIKPGHDLNIDFKRVAREAVALEVRNYSPEELYSGFNSRGSDRSKPGGGIEEIICAAVKRLLIETFDVEVKSINARPEMTDLLQIMAALVPAEAHAHSFKETLLGSNGEEVEFFINFRVAGIAKGGFGRFQNHCSITSGNRPTEKAEQIVGAIKKELESSARANLRSFPADLLRLPKRQALLSAREHLFNDAIESIKTHLGLEVNLGNFRPGVTDGEKRESKQREAQRLFIEQRLAKAREKLLLLDADDGAVAELADQIKKLETDLANFSTHHDVFLGRVTKDLDDVPASTSADLLKLANTVTKPALTENPPAVKKQQGNEPERFDDPADGKKDEMEEPPIEV